MKLFAASFLIGDVIRPDVDYVFGTKSMVESLVQYGNPENPRS